MLGTGQFLKEQVILAERAAKDDEWLKKRGELGNIEEKITPRVPPDIGFVERTSRSALIERYACKKTVDEVAEGTEAKGVTEEQKAKIKEETGWSDEIVDNIQSMDQYAVLKDANVVEVEINGKKCLIKENIDLSYQDQDGVSNRDRMERGLPPLDSKTGKPIELHHLGQKADSPLVELTEEEHRTGDYVDGKKNQSLWHDNTIESEVHGEGNHWKQEREAHWKARVENREG